MEVVTSGYTLKGKLTGFADGLGEECERSSACTPGWMEVPVCPRGTPVRGTVSIRSRGRDIGSSGLDTLIGGQRT